MYATAAAAARREVDAMIRRKVATIRALQAELAAAWRALHAARAAHASLPRRLHVSVEADGDGGGGGFNDAAPRGSRRGDAAARKRQLAAGAASSRPERAQ